LVLFLAIFLWIYSTLPDVSYLKNENPVTTALIEQRRAEAKRIGKNFNKKQTWVRFQTIPDLLKKSIRISEDAGFFYHEGVDYHELQESIKDNLEEFKFARGGSTISQQLAKNLYLSTDKSILRKIKEYFITNQLENELSKNRIFHIYLNVIEFGPGIFGVEAAAKYYFKKSVSRLNLEEIVRLTAIIPQPLKIKANGKSKWLNWRCKWILRKLLLYKYINKSMYNRTKKKFN